MPKAEFETEEAEGAPSFSFAVGYKPAPWEAEAGKSFSIQLEVRSNGQKGTGMRIEASGEALDHLELTRVEVGGEECPFAPKDGTKTLTACFPEFEIPVGVRYPFPQKPKNDDQKATAKRLLDATSSTITFSGTGTSTGRAMLRIEVSVPDSSASALKWIRPFEVR